ncbi:hypothetical protein [Microbispora sp. H10670]|uniref:hypothetical protein n=1 Tax=unclassified Microbispora TaxID=2614687 RepID=UPI0015FEEFC8|nr:MULTISPECIES: hypothetical protein [unclassified Microbispora]
MSQYIDFAVLWKVLLAGLLGGAGLVAVYALGLAALAAGRVYDAPDRGSGTSAARAAGTVVAVACFGLVLAGALLGLYVMLTK